MQILKPKRSATAIRTVSSSMRKPQEEIGKAESQSPEWLDWAALKIAISRSLVRDVEHIALDFASTGLIHEDCLAASAPMGGESKAVDHVSRRFDISGGGGDGLLTRMAS